MAKLFRTFLAIKPSFHITKLLNNVIEDLKKFDTYQDGYVELTKDMFQRNNTNNVFKIEK